MTTIRRPAGRDALHATWLLALVVPLLMAVPYLFVVGVPVVATALTTRRGYRIAPLSLWTAGPVPAVALSSVVGL
ncbi:hypothetical protein [Kitasatospora cineracea]|uniref:hypothetical protein n=1 Tax=Kitasatospora cineracea TaxID=88074 RepID=UPI00382C88B6